MSQDLNQFVAANAQRLRDAGFTVEENEDAITEATLDMLDTLPAGDLVAELDQNGAMVGMLHDAMIKALWDGDTDLALELVAQAKGLLSNNNRLRAQAEKLMLDGRAHLEAERELDAAIDAAGC